MFRKKKEADFINYNSQSYSFNSDKDRSSQKQLSKIHEKLKSSDKNTSYKNNNSFKQNSRLATSKIIDNKPVSNLLEKARNQAILNSKLQPSKTEHGTINIKSVTTRNQLNKFSQKKRDVATSGGLFESKVQMDLLKTHFKNLPNKSSSTISNRLSHKIMNLNETKHKEKRSKNDSIREKDDKIHKKPGDVKKESEQDEIPEPEIKTIDNINELMDRETNSTSGSSKAQFHDSDNKLTKNNDANLQQNDASGSKIVEDKKPFKVPLFKGSNSLKPSYKVDMKNSTSGFEVKCDIKKSSGSGSKGSKNSKKSRESPRTNMINKQRSGTDRFHNKIGANFSSINFTQNKHLNTKFISTDKNLKEVNREYQMRGVKGINSTNKLFSNNNNTLYQKMKANIISGALNTSKSKSNGSSSNLYLGGLHNNKSYNIESGLSSGNASNKRPAIKKTIAKTTKEGDILFIKEGEESENKSPSDNEKNSDHLELKQIIEQKPTKPSQSVNVNMRDRSDNIIRETKYSSQNFVNQIQGMITNAKTVKRTKPGEYNREEPKKYVRTRVVTAVNSQLESSSRMSRVGTSSMSSKNKLSDKRFNSRKALSYQR